MEYSPVTIFGQMVVDHVAHVRHPYESADLRGKAIRWDQTTGRIVIPERSCIATPHIVPPAVLRLVFELPPGEEYKTGDKIKATSVKPVPFLDASELFRDRCLSQLGFPRTVPGGGGTNASYALYNIFGGIEKHYFSVYSTDQDGVIEDALNPLFPSAGLELLKEDPDPSVNIIIEGIKGDRLIVKSPRRRDVRVGYHERLGEFCMVNTCYSWSFAVNGLLEAIGAKKGGVIACTKSLCHKEPIYKPAKEAIRELVELAQNKLGQSVHLKVPSVYAFIRDVVMRHSEDLIYIFNEDELDHFVEGDFDVTDIEGAPIMSGIIRALRWLRGVQRGARPEMIVTLGRHGALYLDREDQLHYCRVMSDWEMQRVAGEKNAIGDLFAATILGVCYGRGDRGVVAIVAPDGTELLKSPVPSILVAASASADSGVYDGFMGVSPTTVSSLIQRKADHYSFFGSIDDIEPSDYAGEVGAVLQRKMECLRKGTVRETAPLNQLVGANLLTA